MSRWVDKLPNGELREEIADINGCRHMYNQICCNPNSEFCTCDTGEDDYRSCIFFEPEETTDD